MHRRPANRVFFALWHLQPEVSIPKISQETLAEMIGTTRSAFS
jgi:hypothetical protein